MNEAATPASVLSPNKSSPPTENGSLWLGFGVDLLLALTIIVVLSLASGLIWGSYQGIALAKQAQQQAGQVDAAQLISAIGQPGAMAQMLMALFSTSVAALLLYYWRRRATREEWRKSLQAAVKPATWGWTFLVAFGVFIFSGAVGSLAQVLDIKLVPTNQRLMEQAMSDAPLFLFVFAVFLAPTYEELLFRRVIFGRFLAANRPWLGMIVSGAAFALVHEVPGISGNTSLAMVQLWLVYGTMGAAFAWLYSRTGTLAAPIAAHALNNAVAVLAMSGLAQHAGTS